MLRILSLLSIMCLVLTGCESKKAASIGIIGGADGPTAVYIAGQLGIARLLAAVLIVFAIGAVVGYKIYKNKKK